MIITVRTGITAALAAVFALVLAGTFGTSALAQSKDGKGRIVCWKDKSGKVVGCGDKVPPEYQDSATREMDRRGVTRGTTESTEDAAKRRAADQEAAKVRAEEQKRLAEQRRQDTALLNTFSNEKEIDQKRDRDLQQIDLQLTQFKVSLKNATDRHTEAKARSDAGSKDQKTLDMLKDDLAKSAGEKQRLEQTVNAKEKEKEEIRLRYADQKKRYLELKGGETTAATPADPRVERAR